MDTKQTTRAALIARANDVFRKGHEFTITHGIYEISDLQGCINAVRTFSNFNESNDPYGEHDFGSLMWQNKKVFWKIDYYDPSLHCWCDPLDPKCVRVLTIMLAEEY